MNLKGIVMNKQILLALGMIIFIGAVVASSTGAFFSSNASATGNTFAAGTMELKIAQNSGSGTPTGGWLDTQVSPLSFSGMAPGGDPSEGAVWLKNEGSVDGMTVGVEMDNPSATEAGMSPLMRITQMDLDGESLLEGGAGANLNEYEAPTLCNDTLSSGDVVDTAIASASSGDIICLEAGTYNEFTVDKDVTVAGLNRPNSGSAAKIVASSGSVTTLINITASDATITGLHVDGSPTTFTGSQLAGIKVDPNPTEINNIEISYNYITDLVTNVSGASAKGIQTFDNGTTGITNSLISHNFINNIEASTNGGYGIQTVSDLDNVTIEHNTARNIDGAWGAGIALDAKTSVVTTNVVVSDNHLIDNIWGAPELGGGSMSIQVEHNVDQNGFTIERNNILGLLHGGGSAGAATGPDVNAQNNWWGDFDPSDQTFGPVDTSNFAGGSFVGFVNGNDANGNDYADFEDLYNDPIVSAEIGLDAGEEKLFELGVQLDGPNTSNAYQGAEYETDFVFTLNQI